MTAKLRVLQISHDYKGPFQNICKLYCEAFPNCDVTTLYLRGTGDARVVEATGGNQTLFFERPEGSLRGLKLGTLWHLFKLFQNNRYDIVIAHRYKAIYLAGIVSFFFPIKVIYGVAHEFKIFHRTLRAFFITRLRPDIQVIAVSNSLADDIIADCPSLGIQSRIHVLENAIDPTLEREIVSRDEARKRFDLPVNVFCFGTVGRLIARKYQDLLIKAYSQVAAPDNCLVVVGSGPQESSLKTLAINLGIEQQVIFVGNVDQAYKYYRAFDAFVFTSDNREAFGVVLLEAMLAKVPVICSDANMPREIVAATGLIFQTGDVDELVKQMKRLKSLDEDQYRSMQQSGFDRVITEFAANRFVQRCQELPQLASFGGRL